MANNFRSNRFYSTALMSHRGTQRVQWCAPEQKEAFEYGPAPLCLNGGFGAGKTITATKKILLISDLFPGNRGVIARRVGDELRKTTMPTFFKDCPPEAYSHGGRRADQEKILNLNPQLCDDGVWRRSEILFLHFDDPKIQQILRGLEINWFLLDQAEEMEEEWFSTLLKRLGRWDQAFVPEHIIENERRAGREWAWWNTPTGKHRPGAKAIPPTYAMLSVNPELEYHWVWNRFHPDSEVYQQKWRPLGYKMITMYPLKNRFLPAQNRQELLSADPEWQERFVYGKWVSGAGSIHKVKPESLVEGTPEILQWIRNYCTLHRALDHGDSAPTCCLWFAVDDSGNVYVYREYYMPDKLISFHRQSIYSLSEEERYIFNVADPQIFAPTLQNKIRRYSVADEYTDTLEQPAHTAIYWIPGDNKDELGIRNRINEYLTVNPDRIHPFTKQKGSPRLFFITRTDEYQQGCSHAVREIKAQRREKIGSDNGKDIYSDDRDPKVPDHSYDCIRYFIASRPPLYSAKDKRKLAGTMLQARMKIKAQIKSNPEWARQQENYMRHRAEMIERLRSGT